jgi:hypothetical protein
MSPRAVSADTIPNSAVGIFSLKTGGTKTKAARVLIRTLKSNKIIKLTTFLKTPVTESVAEKSSWDKAKQITKTWYGLEK